MRLPKGWKENDECIMIFLKAKRKMKEILGNVSSEKSATPPLPDAEKVRKDNPMRLGNFLYNARYWLEKDENKGRNFFALGKALVAIGAAKECTNFEDKDDFLVIQPTPARMNFARYCREERFGLRPFRYAY